MTPEQKAREQAAEEYADTKTNPAAFPEFPGYLIRAYARENFSAGWDAHAKRAEWELKDYREALEKIGTTCEHAGDGPCELCDCSTEMTITANKVLNKYYRAPAPTSGEKEKP